MNTIAKKLLFAFVCTIIILGNSAKADRDVNAGKGSVKVVTPSAAGCLNPTSKEELDINNVRTTLLNAADFWWDLSKPKYEIPKVLDKDKQRSVNAIFSGNLWFGGLDNGVNLKVAAHTYRQGGVDFWSGPIDTTTTSITAGECQNWDKHFKINQKDVAEYLSHLDTNGIPTPDYIIPQSIKEWPGNGKTSVQAKRLAPFFDRNGDGIYAPSNGDYPIYGYDGTGTTIIKPDQFIWWVQNDVGNVHGASNSPAIGLEIQSTAFAFQTSNSLNNTTFYRHVVINRGTTTLKQTYFGVNVDADLGYAYDDYVGCDVGKSLGICYNGDDDDDAAFGGYGLNPPSVGVDFFKGPTDENGKILGMAKFLYYNNNSSVTGNPGKAQDFYNYLRGIWIDGKKMTYGGSGYSLSSTDTCDYMFPGITDPKARRNWTELTESNAPFDRRFMESSGPFTLVPGVRNEVVIGVVWARANSGGATGSFNELLKADIEAQNLFNKDFLLEDGPITPDLSITELDNKLVISLINTKKAEDYSKKVKDNDQKVSQYNFEGYKLYQLKDATVSATDLDNADKASLVAVCDKKNGIIQLINQQYEPDVDRNVPVEKVFGNDNGIKHVFEVSKDLFQSSKPLVNQRTYYFTLVAYAYSKGSVSEPYLAGRLNVKTYTAIPHKINAQYGGSIQHTDFGQGPKITRLSGLGNGGNYLRLTQESINAILNSPTYKKDTLTYDYGSGPIRIKVIDPNKLPNYKFDLQIDTSYKKWTLKNLSVPGEVFYSDIDTGLTDNEQVISKYGFSVIIESTPGPGKNFVQDKRNGFIGDSLYYEDPSNPWFGILKNVPKNNANPNAPINRGWIVNQEQDFGAYNPANDIDPLNVYKNVLEGKAAPMRMIRLHKQFGPAMFNPKNSKVETTPNVDLILTADSSLWSECVVVESDLAASATEGGQLQGNLRLHDRGFGVGRSKFPGYAIDVESGERLNVFFSEASQLAVGNGNDLLFNPTDSLGSDNGVVNGGKHYVYIHNTVYDKCKQIYDSLTVDKNGADVLKTGSTTGKGWIYKNVGWVTFGLFDSKNMAEKLKNTVHIELRVKHPYSDYPSSGVAPHYTFDMSDIASDKNNAAAAKNALDMIGVVPNPYYAYSKYENTEVDSRVKIVNVPGQCVVTIFSINGTLIRKLTKSDDNITSIDWDLRNQKGVTVASGIYLFNIRTYIGGKPVDKLVKWFGVIRQVDLNTF